MLGLGLQHHEINHVDDADADIWNIVAQQRNRSERLKGRYVAGAGHDHVGIASVVAGPMPDAGADGAMANRRIDVEPLPFRLLSGDDQVDVVAAAQTMIRDRQQAICIGWQIDTDDIGFLIRDVIDKTRILMGEAVMVLSPDM